MPGKEGRNKIKRIKYHKVPFQKKLMFKKRKTQTVIRKGRRKDCNAHGSDCTHDVDLVCRNIFKKEIRLGQRDVGGNWLDMRHYGVSMRMSRRRTGVDNVCGLAWLEKGDGYRWKTIKLCAQRIRVGAQALSDGMMTDEGEKVDGQIEKVGGVHNLWTGDRGTSIKTQTPFSLQQLHNPHGLQERRRQVSSSFNKQGKENQRQWTKRDMVQLKSHQKGTEPQSLVRMVETSRRKVAEKIKGGR